MRLNQPHFDLVAVCPPVVYGPLKHRISSAWDLNESNLRIWDLFFNTNKDADMPLNGVHLWVGVRDIADAHLAALTNSNVRNKRFIVSAGAVTSQAIADVLRTNFEELADRTPIGKPGDNTLSPDAYLVDSSLAKEVLGQQFRSVETTFIDLGHQLLDIDMARANI